VQSLRESTAKQLAARSAVLTRAAPGRHWVRGWDDAFGGSTQKGGEGEGLQGGPACSPASTVAVGGDVQSAARAVTAAGGGSNGGGGSDVLAGAALGDSFAGRQPW
jgi:hypothetical protein